MLRSRPWKEGQDRTRIARAVAVVEMVGGRVIEIDCELDQPQAQESRIEVEVLLRVTCDGGDVVNTQGLCVDLLSAAHLLPPDVSTGWSLCAAIGSAHHHAYPAGCDRSQRAPRFAATALAP